MKTVYLLVFFAVFSASAQEDQSTFEMFKVSYLEKWQHSKDYLMAFAEVMPEEYYDFKPTEVEMTFIEQLEHIQQNMEWLSATYLNKKESEISVKKNKKKRLIANLKFSFEAMANCVQDLKENDLTKKVNFFAGEKNKLQILNLIQDHVTHHRGQLAVYLNLKGIKPPKYVGW